MSDLHRKLAGRSIPRGLPPRSNIGGVGARSRGGQFGKKSYTGVSWRKYWRSKDFVSTESGTFCVYEGGSRDAPVTICLLHGAGYSALTWSLMSHHLTSLVNVRVVALDLRGHGESQVSDQEDMSCETMASDIKHILNALLGENHSGVVLIGHSMGGALAAAVAHEEIPGLQGIIVEDVVEGTAIEALAGMHTVLQNRPKQFQSLEQAVEWCVRSGQVRNLESARVSMPGQLVSQDLTLAAKIIEDKVEDADETSTEAPAKREKIDNSDSIKEEDEDDANFKIPTSPVVPKNVDISPPQTFTGSQIYKWRIDLSRTEPYWRGWFQGLSQRFLSAQGAKMLLLAGVDRLDKDLTVGQMQGKFQMQVLPQVGHTVHEDSPEKVAELIASFLVRNKFCSALDNFSPVFPGC